jgi:hypothetical protein
VPYMLVPGTLYLFPGIRGAAGSPALRVSRPRCPAQRIRDPARDRVALLLPPGLNLSRPRHRAPCEDCICGALQPLSGVWKGILFIKTHYILYKINQGVLRPGGLEGAFRPNHARNVNNKTFIL